MKGHRQDEKMEIDGWERLFLLVICGEDQLSRFE